MVNTEKRIGRTQKYYNRAKSAGEEKGYFISSLKTDIKTVAHTIKGH